MRIVHFLKFLVFSIALGVAACQPPAPAPKITPSFEASDLVGVWVADGYVWEGIPTRNERIELRQTPNGRLVAIKTIGSPCVGGAGEMTWRGQLNGDVIVGQAQLGWTDGRREWVSTEVQVLDVDSMILPTGRDRDGKPYKGVAFTRN